MDLVRDAALLNLLRQKERIRGSGAQNGRFEIHHHLQLLVGVAGSHGNRHRAELLTAVLETDAGPHGNRHRAELLTAVLETDAGRPETITRGNVNAVLCGHACELIAALEHLAPVIYVLGGVGDDHGHTGCAGGRVDADHFLLFAGHKSQRIRFAKVLLLGKGKIQEVLHCADVVDAGFLEALSIEIVSGDQTLDLMIHLCQLLFVNLHFYFLLLSSYSCSRLQASAFWLSAKNFSGTFSLIAPIRSSSSSPSSPL